MNIRYICLSVAISSTSFALAAGQNWPQWRGPLQNGSNPDANPPAKWSETENIKWKIKLPGSGSATPIVWGNQIFVQTAIPTGKKSEPAKSDSAASAPGDNNPGSGGPGGPPGGRGGPGRGGPGRGRGGGQKPSEVYQFVVLCIDADTGKIAWQKIAREEVPHEGFHQEEGSFAAPSGLTDGKHYFAYFGSRGLYSYDFQGKQEWNKDLGKMRIAMGFGEGSSLALHKDTLIVKWDNEDGSYVTALDKNSGNTLWKQDRDEGTSWSSPLIIEHNGRAEVITSATRKIRSYDLATGKVLWECGGLTRNVIPTPVADNDRVYCMSGFMGNSLLAVKLGGSGDLTGTDSIAWTYKKSTPYVPSPLLCDGRLYFLSGNNGVISCLDAATGKVLVDAERLEGLSGSYVSPIAAGGRIYIAGRNGSTVVLKLSDDVEILATNHLDDRFDASPVAIGKSLILRGRESLYLIAQK